MKKFFAIFLLSCICNVFSTSGYKAVVIVPITDLVGQPMAHFYPYQSVEKSYNSINLCGGTVKNDLNCARLHQLIFNNIVDVVADQGQEIQVCLSNLFYTSYNNNNPNKNYWMLKKHVIPLQLLEKNTGDKKSIPQPFFCDGKNYFRRHYITLKEPFYDTILDVTFSVGTQFVVHKKIKNIVQVLRYNNIKKHNDIITIPKNIIIDDAYIQSKEQCVTLFVDILKKFAHQKNGAIAYVLGGCSFAYSTLPAFKHEQRIVYNNQLISFYTRTLNMPIKNGFDCSGLITCAAQMAHIPYFLKNSFTVQSFLKTVDANESLQVGDIIWIPGHVMVVSDIDNNMMIEARSYHHGYGIVHEICLNKVFKDIETYSDLRDAIRTKKTVIRIDKQGKKQNTITQIKLLSLKSCWQK